MVDTLRCCASVLGYLLRAADDCAGDGDDDMKNDGNDLEDLYKHEGLDDQCLPIEIQKDDEEHVVVRTRGKNLNIYNYYGPIYGDANIDDLDTTVETIVNGLD